MKTILLNIFIIIVIIGLFIAAIIADVYDINHRINAVCEIVYQNNPGVNWQKFCDVKFKYKNNIYIAKVFHDNVDLMQNKGLFYIYIDDDNKVYKSNFVCYVKD